MKSFSEYIWLLLASVLGFFSPIMGLLVATVSLVLIGSVLEWIADKEKRKFKKAFGVYLKTCFLYSLGIIAGRLMEILFFDGVEISKMIAGAFALFQFKNLLKNFSALTGINILPKFTELEEKQKSKQ
jgi:uncharacterized membrane protein